MSTATTAMKNYTDSTSTTATLFEMFDTAAESQNMFTASSTMEMNSKPRQVLGESVFSRFVKTEEIDFPALGLDKLEVPELSPSVGTVTPLQLHSSIVESIFSPSLVESTPMFDDVELDSSNWTSLFEPSEMEIPVKEEKPAPIPTPVATATATASASASAPTPESIVSSPLFETALCGTKRSSSEADLSQPSGKRLSCSTHEVDEFGVTAYNRKQRTAPLTPIVVDNSDPVAAKRARNTEAARRSRARKMERMYQLEEKVDDLVSRNKELEAEVLRLRALLGQH